MIGWQDLRREPYRLLFPLGAVFGCAGVLHWLFYALGVSGASSFTHASLQLGAFVYCFMAGFLLTAMPRMTGSPPASFLELLALLGLLAAQAMLLTLKHAIAAQACFAGLLVLLAVFAGQRLAVRRSPREGPTEFVWIPIGVAFGLVGSGLLVASLLGAAPDWLGAAGRVMAQQGFTLSVVFGIGGFLAPRLLGRTATVVRVDLTPERARRARAARVAGHVTAAGLLGWSFLLEGAGHAQVAYVLRAIVATLELGRRSQVWKRPLVKDFYVRLMWLSLWCVLLGLWAVAVWPRHRVAMLHVMLIGGLSLMIFAVGTMVVLSHAGQANALQRPLWVLRGVAAGVSIATLARVLADFWPVHYFTLLGVAAVAWLLMGMSWFVFSVPWVLRAASPDEFERMHQETKQRLLREQAPNRC